jgi:hypothetical protein
MAGVTYGPSRATSLIAWIGDYLDREHMVPGGARLDAAQFRAEDAVVVDVGAAGAAQGATAVPVVALSGPIPSGTVLDFGTTKFARLTAAAAAGATSLTVAALPTALVDADIATYPGTGKKTVQSGTLLGRTFAERDAGTGFGPAAAADDEIFLLVFDVTDATLDPNCELYRHGSIVKDNFLPNWTTMGSTLQGAIRSRYQCVRGAN